VRADRRLALRRPVVLAYHGVNAVPADDRLDLVMPPERLAAQVRALQRLRYRFMTADELVDLGPGGPPPAGTAVLTFDDGWRDALTVVLPLLRDLGVRATFYVNPGLWGATHHEVAGEAGRLLSEQDARELADAGMDLGCHAWLHRDLRGLDDAELAEDLRRAKAGIESISGQRCRTLAYPYGAYDERVEAAAVVAGFDLAFAWLPGPWRATAAPRLPGPTRHGGGRLLLKLAGIRRRRTVGPPPQRQALDSR
jgi:peptidoglycan/xylan/chitin deacetylase (PgdA/CDA1 family)